MKDVFISYASEDRAIAQRLAAGLEAAGISVWWDRQIQVGSEWDKGIEDALEAATCAVVLWTGHSKQSRWVRAEARAALKKEKVVPVMLEADAIPLAFTGIQALRCLEWDGSAGSKEFPILLEVVQGKLAGKPIILPEAVSTKASWVGKVAALVGVKTALSVVGALLVMGSSLWRIDAEVAMQVQTGRIAFTVNPGLDQKRLTDSLYFKTLSLEPVGHLSLSPTQLFVANPDELDWEADTYPPKAWVGLTSNGPTWVFQSASSTSRPMVTFEAHGHMESPTGKLDAMVLSQRAFVTLESTDDNTVTVTIRTEIGRQRVVLSSVKQVEMVEEGLRLESVTPLPFTQDQELTYQALFGEPSGTIIAEGNDTTFIAVIQPSDSLETELFSKTVLPLESVDVSWQDPKTGERVSHPQFQGMVRYTHLQDFPEVQFQAPMFLTVEDLHQFEITGIRHDPSNQTLVIDLQGTAGTITTGTRGNPQDLRPTVFDVIRFHPVLKPLRNVLGL